MIKINLKKINFDDIFEKVKSFLVKHKLAVTSLSIVALLACISFLISYAYFKVMEKDVIIGGTVGEIPDIDIRVMVEDRDNEGNALGTYSEYPYVPQAGYEYNEKLSYCTHGSDLIFGDDFSLTVDTEGTELCFAYFDATANLDINLEVYIQEVNELGEGLANEDGNIYRMIAHDEVPTGYKFNVEKSNCTLGTLSYNSRDNRFIIVAPGKTFCKAYMDAVAPDVLLEVFLQKTPGVSNTVDDYYRVEKNDQIPTNMYYEFSKTAGLDSSCKTGGTISLENQSIAVKADQKTVCTAYLDIVTGPIVSEIALNNNKVALMASPIGTPISKWYYSTGGDYQEIKDGVIANDTQNKVSIYGEDADGKKTAIIELDSDKTYFYEGVFTKDTANEFTVVQAGYYYLQAWGASENEKQNAGSYAEGYVYLNKGDKVYVSVGVMPQGETNIKINTNNDNNRLLIAGENLTYAYSEETAANYPGTCALNNKYYLVNSHIYQHRESFVSPTGAMEKGHFGDGYVKISYIGQTIE